jgi:hypothetical protein
VNIICLERWIAREKHVARVAGSIGDPVSRLRFLKSAAPRRSFARMLSHLRIHHWIVWASLLLALVIPFLMKPAAEKPDLPHLMPILPPQAAAKGAREAMPVWQVEQNGDSEAFSNGLRIDTRFTVANRPRLYTAFQRDGAASVSGVRRSQPAGIVYHTTESCQAPFEEQDTPVLKRLGESLLEYVRRKRAYHYLIDRFGRVYRVVAESDTAYHAGYSVWADDEWFYVNLNEGFIGIAFEAQMHSGQTPEVVSPAQVRAAARLTEMLRSRYHVAARDCVTHAQVSVNPSNMLVGYHTDWATGFPFEALGLPDNYRLALPAVWAFGFDCEPAWLAASGERMSFGVKLAEQDTVRRAAAAEMPLEAYRKALREQYRAWLAEVRRTNPPVDQLRSGSAGR